MLVQMNDALLDDGAGNQSNICGYGFRNGGWTDGSGLGLGTNGGGGLEFRGCGCGSGDRKEEGLDG